MTETTMRLTALITLAAVAHVGCYNTYTIDDKELEKLESSVEPREVVMVLADCPAGTQPAPEPKTAGVLDDARALAQADEAGAPAEGGEGATASDGAAAAPAGPEKVNELERAKAEASARGCVAVPVSTANSMRVLTKDKRELRVTPFNFIMDERQLVSPEYDLLLSRRDLAGAEVKEFSTWKTVVTIAGVTALAVGSFVAISVLAPEEQGFQ